ncbi:uncharacterized protein LOC130749707 isoform X2 [Lotus japonicus]|uniref:uncharacterized protein LOC130749707 isoform X2 n=1 Tax=Lotus japonicus TaxID=34305 RepID=UPI00258D25EC|nr:uncharacterized protein LOC130749707 isoform X2 [Lotus japonicus]
MNLQSLTPFLPRSRQASSQIGIFLFNSSIREPETVFAENSCVISLQQTLVDLLDLVGRRILVGPVLPFISSFALYIDLAEGERASFLEKFWQVTAKWNQINHAGAGYEDDDDEAIHVLLCQ